MERFIFVAAIVFAVIFGVVAMVGGGRHFHFDVDGRGTDAVMPISPGRAAARTFAGDELQFKYIAAHVTITPEDRQDISIEIDNPGHVPMPTIFADGDRIIVDGHLSGRLHDCSDVSADVRGYSTVATAEMPQIVVHAPRALHVEYAGAGLAEIGPTQSLNLDVAGCGGANAGDVAEALEVNLRGSGQVHTAAAHSANISLMGSGGLTTGAIADGADVDVLGSGTLTIGSLTGTLEASSHGSGGVNVSAGAITTADLDLLGSGGITIAAPIHDLKASIRGSGDVTVNGAVGDVDADITGSGGVHATSITGTVHKEIHGSGDVTTG
jgi:hypothetical protein